MFSVYTGSWDRLIHPMKSSSGCLLSSVNMLTSHKVHQPEISLAGDRAKATWALDDVVVHLDCNITIRDAAFYHDEYAKTDGHWLI